MESSSNWADRHWLRWQTAIWICAAAAFIWMRWGMIQWYALPDTDDNLRMAQVHAWLAGQGWYDLRQYKLNPPTGFNIHWSRLVDLPIAGLELAARPFVGGLMAQKFAAATAPLIPLWVALAGAGMLVRRLVDPRAALIGAGLLLCCGASLLMYMPMRVDHHGWQLALLMLTVAGLADRQATRGGLTMGASSAASLVIGLELMPFLVIAGAAAVLRWVWDAGDTARLRSYGVMLAGGCAAGYLGFASYDNAVPRCDVLSPVWLSVMVAAGTLAFVLAELKSADWRVRLALAAAGGIALAGFFALAWPQCLGRPEQISPELATKWFNNIREAKPLTTQSWQVALGVVALPVAGVIGSFWAAWIARKEGRFGAWAPVALVSLVSLLLVLWQTRQGPAAQFMAIPGAAWLIWTFVPRFLTSGSVLVRTLGVVGAVLVFSGLAVPLAMSQLPPGKPPTARDNAIGKANGRCPTLPALAPIARLPATTIFTFVDMGPRLVSVTHHRAIAGPYHRNGDAILDVHHAFDGDPDTARAIMLRHGATLLMTCPNMSESTVYRARSPNGFYARLAGGEKFAWLEPVPLPEPSPLLLWRIK
jgi:hypothetical protein